MRTTNEYIKTKFENVSELQRLGMALDPAVETTAYYKHPVTGVMVEMEDKKSIFNMDTNKQASVVGKDYTLLEHRPIVDTYTNILTSFNLGSFGTIHDFSDRIYIETAFGKRDIIDGVKLGVRLKNSYDYSSSFGMQAFGYRTACANGMFLGKVMKAEVSLSKKHLGEINVKELIMKFIQQLVESENSLKMYISDAMKDSIEWETINSFLDSQLTKKCANTLKLAFMDKMTEGKLTRWDLYNALTWYSTHQITSDIAQDKMQDTAQKILIAPLVITHEN